MDELETFEGFEDPLESEIASTDEIMVAGYVKEATKKGMPAWLIEEKVRKTKPKQVWIVPRILGVEKSVSTEKSHLISDPIPALACLDSIKKRFLKFLKISLGPLLLAAGCYSLIKLVIL